MSLNMVYQEQQSGCLKNLNTLEVLGQEKGFADKCSSKSKVKLFFIYLLQVLGDSATTVFPRNTMSFFHVFNLHMT